MNSSKRTVGHAFSLVCLSLIALLQGLSLSSCAFLGQRMVEEPKVEIQGVSVRDMDRQGATAVFVVSVGNPNPFALKVDGLRYEVEIDGSALTSGRLEKSIEVDARKSAVVELPVPINYATVFSTLAGFIGKSKSAYRIRGEASFGLLTVPFDKSGELKLR